MSIRNIKKPWDITAKDYSKFWDTTAKDYSKLIVPNRPSLDDCENYGLLIAKVLKNRKRPRIMVMGSTPELRSILLTYTMFNQAQVYCVDINPIMYWAMTDFIIKANLKEKFIKKSWLKTGFRSKFFDLILGDEVICNIPINQHLSLFKEVHRILKPNGFWITRHNFYLRRSSKKEIERTILDLVKKIKKGQYSFQRALNTLHPLVFYYLVSLSPEHKGCLDDELRALKSVYRKSKNKVHKQVIKKLISLTKKNFGERKDYYWYTLSKKQSEAELRKFFIIKKVLYSNDYITAKFSPIYLLKKKIIKK